uniref:Putative ovule protein n=1 Tax=Solanum chacoense TaxID=4108 RepID=A0A0V0GYK8_SOLCH
MQLNIISVPQAHVYSQCHFQIRIKWCAKNLQTHWTSSFQNYSIIATLPATAIALSHNGFSKGPEIIISVQNCCHDIISCLLIF